MISARYLVAAVVGAVALVAVVLVSIGGDESQETSFEPESTVTSSPDEVTPTLEKYTADQLTNMELSELQNVATARRISIGALSRGALIEAILLAQQPLRSESKGCPGCWVR